MGGGWRNHVALLDQCPFVGKVHHKPSAVVLFARYDVVFVEPLVVEVLDTQATVLLECSNRCPRHHKPSLLDQMREPT